MNENLNIKARLSKKKEELKQKIIQRSRMELINELIEHFKFTGIPYEINWKSDELDRRLEAHFPFTSFGVLNWEEVAEKYIQDCMNECNFEHSLIFMINKYHLDENTKVSLLWGNSERPIIEMTLSNIRENLSRILDEDTRVWMMSEFNQWCIEYRQGEIFGIAINQKSN